MCNMWMVRCGSKSKAFDYFKNNNIVAIRWSKLGNLNDFENKYELRDKLKNSLHITKYQKLISDSSIIWKFVHEINIGDYVVTSATRDEFYIGQVTSDYIYNINELREDNHFINQRKVKWLGGFSKNEFNENIQRSLNAQSTVYSLDKIKDDILNVLNNKIIQENKGTTTPKLSFYSSFKSNYSRNKIFFGAPGTGKSYLLNKEKEDLIHDDGYFERVTFYPSYSYSHFVGTYKPVSVIDNDNEVISYRYVPGPFMRVLVKSLKNIMEDSVVKPHVLVIEEINRGNVAAIFGDIFQLLDRDSNNISNYSIQTSMDMRKYLQSKLGGCIDDYAYIKIPDNMFIWATMNSADQGVFDIDTAFKRRWDFEYIGINNNQEEIKDIYLTIGEGAYKQRIQWNKLRCAINEELLSYNINEDKLLGPFFAFNNIDNSNTSPQELNNIFKNKILMYLFEDAGKSKRNVLFSGSRKNKNYVLYSKICSDFDKTGLSIFCDNIKDKFEE